jgi:hypothetical protein
LAALLIIGVLLPILNLDGAPNPFQQAP